MDSATLSTAVGIFLATLVIYSLLAVRLMAMVRGKQAISAVIAFVESAIFILIFQQVVTDLNQLPILAAYCFGVAIGNDLGMEIEARLIVTYMRVNIVAIDPENALHIATALRGAGFGVTTLKEQGRDGQVNLVSSIVRRTEHAKIIRLVQSITPDAFVTAEELQSVQRGWFQSASFPFAVRSTRRNQRS
jgi:uncharacterized protein YebE (UPF0316 family)